MYSSRDRLDDSLSPILETQRPSDMPEFWFGFSHPPLQDPMVIGNSWEADARGWPLLSLWSCMGGGLATGDMSSWPDAYPEISQTSLPPSGKIDTALQNSVGETVTLPLYPIWPGFAINTVFYAAICWLLWMTPFTARRMIRRRRGRCPNCGYDLAHAEHEQCPECGAKT